MKDLAALLEEIDKTVDSVHEPYELNYKTWPRLKAPVEQMMEENSRYKSALEQIAIFEPVTHHPDDPRHCGPIEGWFKLLILIARDAIKPIEGEEK